MMRAVFLLMSALFSLAAAAAPNLMLLNTYDKQDLTGWVMSEKLDGVRGYWDGQQIYSRGGEPLSPPHYFIQNFPPFAIDGELYSERNRFEQIVSIVRSHKGSQWSALALHVFDVPDATGTLPERLAVLKDYLAQHPTPYIRIIEQIPIQHAEQVQAFLDDVIQAGGEGIVVRNPNAPYERKRSSQILKLKPVFDEECQVVAHHKGRGQFANVMGALSCENHRGRFRIGSGFTLDERANPPPVGSIITYQYRGVTQAGKPKFPTYWRQKPYSTDKPSQP